MALYKNVASQKLAVFAWDTINDAPKTGDAANITAKISKDVGGAAATNDVNPTELDGTNQKGIYYFDLTQAETNANFIIVSAVSATANVLIDPITIYTFDATTASVATAAALTVIDDFLDTEVAAILEDTGTTLPATLATLATAASIAALNNLSAADVNAQVDAAFTTQMADSIPADGSIATREQALYMLLQFLLEREVSGTTMTVKKVDGTTALFTLTLNDGSAPTSITRAT